MKFVNVKKFLFQKWLSIVLVAGCAGIFLFNFISLFLPFAQYSQPVKAILIGAGYALFYFLCWRAWKHWMQPNLAVLKQHWLWHSLVALVFTALVLSLTQTTNPLYPVEHTIEIQTTGRLQFSRIIRETSNGEFSTLPSHLLTLQGDWNERNDMVDHQSAEPASILFRQMLLISDPVTYYLYFKPQATATDVDVLLNGTIFPIHIPSYQETNDFVIYEFTAPPVSSYSAFYRLWQAAYPVLRWTMLLIFYFSASVFIRTRAINKTNRFAHYTLLLVYSYLLFNSLNYQNQFVNFTDHNLVFFAAALAAFVLLPLGMIALLRQKPRTELVILIFIFLTAIGLRIYWIAMVPTAQVSDFGDFHRWALQLASGEPNLVMDRYATFTRALSLLYRITPSESMAEGLNIVLSLVSMAGLVWIGREIKHPHAGLLAAYFFAIFPSQIGMTGIVCTDILATATLVISAAFLARYWNHPRWFWLAGSAAFAGLGFSFRSTLIIYATIFLLPVLAGQVKTLKRIALFTVIIVAAFTAGVLSVKAAISPARVENMVISESRNIIWPLLNGVNIEAKGRNNNADTAMVFGWTPAEAYQKGIPLVIDRIFSDPAAFYRLLKVKYNYMFANASYGADLAFIGEDMNFDTFQTNWPYDTQDIRTGYAQLSQYSYWLVLAAALAFVFRFQPSLKPITWLNLFVILSALGAYAFFEVQPRYQRPIIPFILLTAALFYVLPSMRASKTQNRLEDQSAERQP